jgi:phosphoglycerol transferase
VNPAVLPAQEKNRVFTTMDMYPTILGSMGVTIENERLGLGTNLFSGEETLSEKYGNEYLFEELLKKSNFYNTALLYPES